MEKSTFKLTFKPINVAKALHILTQDLNNDVMSDEIIQEIGEVFMKHMFYKVYEENENLTNNTLPNELDEFHIEENKMEIEGSPSENNNGNDIKEEREEYSHLNNLTASSPLASRQTKSSDGYNFNEREEKKKLMKYLTLGWYIYNYCIA